MLTEHGDGATLLVNPRFEPGQLAWTLVSCGAAFTKCGAPIRMA